MGVVAAVVIGIALLTGVAVVLGLVDSAMSVEPVDRIDDGLPDRPLSSRDVSGLRFRVGLRGYRMDDVDRAVDRLRDALRDAEERCAAAERAPVAPEPVADAAPKRPRARRSPRAADPSDGA